METYLEYDLEAMTDPRELGKLRQSNIVILAHCQHASSAVYQPIFPYLGGAEAACSANRLVTLLTWFLKYLSNFLNWDPRIK